MNTNVILLTLKRSAKRKLYRTSGVESIGYNLHSENTGWPLAKGTCENPANYPPVFGDYGQEARNAGGT